MLKKLISQIPGEDGWWKSRSEEEFNKYAVIMREKGFTEKETVDLLEKIYWSVASCYGD